MSFAPETSAPAPEKKKRRKWPFVVGGIVAIGVVIGVTSGGSTPTTPAAPAPIVAPAVPAAQAPAQPAAPANPTPAGQAVGQAVEKATVINEGEAEVGVDIVAGKYKTTGPNSQYKTAGVPCYVQISKDDSGALSSIVSNDNVPGVKTITVKNGQFVKNNGCAPFIKVG